MEQRASGEYEAWLERLAEFRARLEQSPGTLTHEEIAELQDELAKIQEVVDDLVKRLGA